MGPIIRRFTARESGSGGALTAQSAEIHWLGAGRNGPDILTSVPSIHMAWNGQQPLGVDRRALRLDDEVFVVLNAGHVLSTRGQRDAATCLLSVYFGQDLLQQALDRLPMQLRNQVLVDTPSDAFLFFEHLRERDQSIVPVMRYLAHHIVAGVEDPYWIEEQVQFLLQRLLSSEAAVARAATAMSRTRPARRREALMRLTRVTDLIHTAFERDLSMEELAAAAHWSVFHMMREFKTLYGISPFEFLQRRRTQSAAHLLRSTDLPVTDIALRVGFIERSTLMRRLQRDHGIGARALRQLSREQSSRSPQPVRHRMTSTASSSGDATTSMPAGR